MKSLSPPRRHLVGRAALIIAWLYAGHQVAGAVESLARLVPADAGLCIEVDDLATHSRRFLASDLYQRLRNFEPVREMVEDAQNRISGVGEEMARQLELAPQELVDGLFGQRAALAVWPQTVAEAEMRSGLLLFEVENRDLLTRALDGMSSAQRKAGAIVAESRTKHQGETYEVRIFGQPNSETKVYFAALGNIGVITGCDRIMQQVLELKSQPQNTPTISLAHTDAYGQGIARLKPNAAIKLFVNPRRWDDMMREELARDADDDEAKYVKQALVQAWLVADYWVGSADFNGGVALETYLHFDPAALPEPLDEITEGLTGRAEFLHRVPQDAIFAIAGRVDMGRLARLFLEAGDEASLRQLDDMRDFGRGVLMGLDVFDDVLTSLGPDLGMFLLADEEEAGMRLAMGAQMQSRPAGDERPDVAEALDGGARNLMAVASTFLNNRRRPGSEPARVKTIEVGDTKITSLANLDFLPWNMEASYAIVDDYFLFGTSAETLRRTIELDEAGSLSQSPRLRDLIGASLSEPGQVLYIDCAPFREFMKTHRDLFSTAVTMSRGVDRELARRAISQLEQWLVLADTIVVASKVDSQGFSMSVGISTAQDEAATLTLSPNR